MREKSVDGVKVQLTQEQEQALLAQEALDTAAFAGEIEAKAKRAQMLAGVEINGVMCSATRSDQVGLNAIATGVMVKRSFGQTFPDTVFEFQNGATLLITDSNFNSIFESWTTFRQSFFAPPQ